MLFNSIDFIIFLPIVLLIYFILPTKLKNFWLLISSYYFYMCWNAKYVMLIFTSTLVTYLCGILLDKINHSGDSVCSGKKLKITVLTAGLIINLGLLFFFKYSNFTLSLISHALSICHINVTVPYFDILLPVGISFYTFQAVGYTIDVYRGDVDAEHDFFTYALFVSFFPQLVAGPIERSRNLLGQIRITHKFEFDNLREGFLLMLWGFFMKLIIADRISVLVNSIYDDLSAHHGWYIVIAAFAFSIQLYCDFYGYSTIAMGASKILGISLMDNFNAPFYAPNIPELWRRWHISLTSWFTDYIYKPLGGSRKGTFRKYLNIMIVFTISGLWHGAGLNFILWGIINGLYQVIGDILRPMKNKFISFTKINVKSVLCRTVQVIFVFTLFTISFIPFRVHNLYDAFVCIKEFLLPGNPEILIDGSLMKLGINNLNLIILIVSIIILAVADYYKYQNRPIRFFIMKQSVVFRWFFVVIATTLILTFGIWGPSCNSADFVYFQF